MNNLIAVINPKQALMHMKHGCKCECVRYENGKMVFYFDRVESYPLFTKWCRYELK